MSRLRDYEVFGGPDEARIKAERAKARRLRGTAWWQRRISAGICHYCGRQVGREALTMDHVVPLSRGGTSSKGNLVPCCKECNTAKKTRLPLEWENGGDEG